MEKFQKSLVDASHSSKVADHMIFVTYTIVKDPKLLLAAMKNVLNSMITATDALLQYERLFKRIPAVPQNLSAKLLLLKKHCSRRYHLSQNYIFLINDLNNIVEEHKKSPVEFTRKDKFVICSNNYHMKTITIKKIKEYISINKSYLKDVRGIVNKNGIFKRREKAA